MSKAIVLLSGGLDSMLAVKVLQAQKIEVEGICFESNFFTADKAKLAAKQIGIKLNIINTKNEILTLVKNPPSGYGKNMNPCLDCHALMVRTAWEKLGKSFDIIATGEVLGQRPFSQNKDSLARVQKLAGVNILRPLSAKLLPETEYEKNLLVNRERLLDISGRTRNRQFELAEKFGIKEYPSPAGGCLLTDPDFSQRLNELLENWPDCTIADVEILKNGRIKWFNLKNLKQKVLVIIGRKAEDNNNLERLAQIGDIMIRLKDIPGPNTLLRIQKHKFKTTNNTIAVDMSQYQKISLLGLGKKKNEKELIETVAILTATYVTKARKKKIEIEIIKN